MRMISRPTGPRFTAGSLLFVFLAVLCIGVILFLRIFFAATLWYLLSPLLNPRAPLQRGISSLEEVFTSKAALENENSQLKVALASSTAALADRDLLYEENVVLKNDLGRSSTPNSILATVIMRPPALPYDMLFIDLGSKDGISDGDLVVAGGTTVVGFISTLYSSKAEVTLFSTPGESFSALLHIADGSIIPVTISGQGGGSLFGEVPAGTSVIVGDSLELPSIWGGFIATVSAVNTQEGQSVEMIYLHMPVNPFTLQYVEVWK